MKRFKCIGVWLFHLMAVIGYSQEMPIGWASLNGGTTGGAGGDTIYITTENELVRAINLKKKRIIVISDTIVLSEDGEKIKYGNLTVLGTGNAMLRNGGLKLEADNIIVRNLSLGDSYINGHWDGKGNAGGDALTIYGKNIWIDHCVLFHSFDGLLDISKKADFVTVSWTKFTNHNKVMLIGSKDTDTISRGHLNTTIHHCWFDGYSTFYDPVDEKNHRIQQRMPRVRFGKVHVYNNYYESAADYCIAARIESEVVVENCYFRNLSDPLIIDDIGKGLKDPEMVAKGNIYDNVKGDIKTNGDAFDPSALYTYKPDKTIEVPALVMNGAGRFNRNNNRPPVATNDTFQVKQPVESNLLVLRNDEDPDGDSLRISVILNKPRGSVVVFPDHIGYKPPKAYYGEDIIEYQVIDYEGGTASATCYIKIE